MGSHKVSVIKLCCEFIVQKFLNRPGKHLNHALLNKRVLMYENAIFKLKIHPTLL